MPDEQPVTSTTSVAERFLRIVFASPMGRDDALSGLNIANGRSGGADGDGQGEAQRDTPEVDGTSHQASIGQAAGVDAIRLPRWALYLDPGCGPAGAIVI